MTHSGGKPHHVGDKGQRYEVSYFDPVANARKVFGWSDTVEGAQGMGASIEAHPSWQFVQILDPDGEIMKPPKILDAVVDKVLAHKPKPKSTPARKRARRAKKIAKEQK